MSTPSHHWQTSTARHGRRRRVRVERKKRWPVASLALGCVAILGAALAISQSAMLDGMNETPDQVPASFTARLDQLASHIGLGIDQVEISGQRFASDADILDAVDLANVRSFLTFNNAAVRARIERLPWIASATIERRMPNELGILVKERVPFAIWRNGARDVMIDRTGRELSAIVRGSAIELPRVEGHNAAEDATRLLDLVAQFPEVAVRLDHAERVAGRRWRLVLRGDMLIELPAEADAAALSMLVEPRAGGRLIDVAAGTVDMTVLRRITVRPANAAKAG